MKEIDMLERGQRLVAVGETRAAEAVSLAALPPESGLLEAGFDLAFIDGDHPFVSVLADFIALHDILPLTAAAAAPQRQTAFYTGDGWKIIPCLRALRPDLWVYTIPTAPTGRLTISALNAAFSRRWK